MEINEVTEIVVDEAVRLHAELGPGLLESVYEVLLAHRLQQRGLSVLRQVPIPIRIDGISFEEGFRADLIVTDSVLVELKSTELNHPVYAKQLLTRLRLTGKTVGLLLNFGQTRLKDGLKRIVHKLPAAQSLPSSASSAAPRENRESLYRTRSRGERGGDERS